MVLPSGKHYLDPEVLSRDPDRALNHPNQVGMHAVGPIMRRLLRQEAIRRYAIRKVTTPVPVEGAWRTFHERRHFAPWAQEAERIGVPPPHHRGGPG